MNLCFAGGSLLCQFGFSVSKLLFGGLHLGLGGFQIRFGTGELCQGIVHFLVNSIPDLFVECIDQILGQHHMKLLGHSTGGADPGHTRHTLQLAKQAFVQVFRQCHRVHTVFGNGGHHDRQHGRVDLQYEGRLDHSIPAAGQGNNALLDIHTYGIQIDSLLEFQHNHTVILCRGGGDLLDPVQGSHRLFQGFCYFRFHLFRVGAGVGGHQYHIRKVHIGKQIRGHIQVGYHTQSDHRNYGNKDR